MILQPSCPSSGTLGFYVGCFLLFWVMLFRVMLFRVMLFRFAFFELCCLFRVMLSVLNDAVSSFVVVDVFS